MSTKWKYASLPASERLGLIRNGNEDVYKNELERSRQVISARKNAGLDISEQKKWVDSVGYNYSLYNAEKAGIPLSRVNSTGYADSLLGIKPEKSGKKGAIGTVTPKSQNEYKAAEYLKELGEKLDKAAKGKENVYEWLVNNGIDSNSEAGKKRLDAFDDELEVLAEKYKKEYLSAVKALYR